MTATARWARETFATDNVRLVSIGPRTSVVARVRGDRAGSLSRGHDPETTRFAEDLIRENKSAIETPELFCFGLLERFDLPQLEALAMPAK